MTPDPLERLTAARPAIATRGARVLDETQRAALLGSILSTPPKATSPPTAGHRRRRPWVFVSGAVVAAVVVVALLVAPLHSSDASAVIVARATATLDGHTSGVLVTHERQYGARPTEVDGWFDAHDTHRFRLEFFNPPGPPEVEGEYVLDSHVVSVTLNPTDRVATILTLPLASAAGAPPQGSVSKIRALLRSGALTVAGHQRVDGKNTLRVTGHIGHDRLEVWIDATTYEIVRSQDIEHGVRSVENLTWLPATGANLALLTVPIPPGYSQQGSPSAPPIQVP